MLAHIRCGGTTELAAGLAHAGEGKGREGRKGRRRGMGNEERRGEEATRQKAKKGSWTRVDRSTRVHS
jgi:Mg-chelatase subunit ChlD